MPKIPGRIIARDRFPDISDQQLRELQQFREWQGYHWKGNLLYLYWEKAKPIPGFPALAGLRNSHGPSWLERFDIKAEIEKRRPW